MAIDSVGTPKSTTSGKPTAPARPVYSEAEGASRIAALLNPTPDKKPPRDATNKQEKPAAPVVDEQDIDEEDEGEFSVATDDDTDDEVEAKEPNDDSDDEDGDDTESRTEEDDEGSDDEALQLDPKQRVKHPKTGELVTIEELYNGYLRQKDYTKKTQEVATQRKALEPELTSVRKEREEYAGKLKQLDEALKETAAQEPDWDREFTENPEEAPALYARWQHFKTKAEAVAKERQAAEEKVQKDREAQFAEHMRHETESLRTAMKWTKPEEASKGFDAILTYGESLGFEKAQLVSVTDHRLFVVMDKARRWDAAQKKAKATTKAAAEADGAPRPVRPGQPGSTTTSSPARQQRTELTRAKQRLAKTGSTKDAAAAISLLMQPVKRR